MSPVIIPHLRVVVFFCLVAIAFYGGFSIYIVWMNDDPALKGDVIGTWKSFATAAFFFWVGASSGGKARDANTIPDPAATSTSTTLSTSSSGPGSDPLDLAGAEFDQTKSTKGA